MRPRNSKKRVELIQKHAYRVEKAVGAFLRRYPERSHLRDDLTSEGMARLISSIDRYLRGKIKSLPTYLRLSILSGLWDVVRLENVIQSPRYCPARRCHDQALSSYPDAEEAGDDNDTKRVFEMICLDESDQIIVSMLREERSLRSIAGELCLSGEELKQKMDAIGHRLKDVMNESV